MVVSSQDHPSEPTGSTVTPPLAYPLASTAFERLIKVEVLTTQLIEELRSSQRLLGTPEYLPHAFWYLAPLPAELGDEVVHMRDQRRAQRPVEFEPYWATLDPYHLIERRWRAAILEAKTAVDCAKPELDRPDVDPLQSTSSKIQRVLQALHLAVPAPLVFGDIPPIGIGCEERLAEPLRELATWIDELRILRDSKVRLGNPRPASGRPPEGRGDAQRRQRAVAKLSDEQNQRLVLEYLMREGIKTRDDALKLEAVLVAVFSTASRSGKTLMARMSFSGLIDSKRGARGGYWITEKGCAALRPGNQHLD